MSHGRIACGLRLVAAMVVAAGIMLGNATTASAQDGPNTGAVSLSAGVDFTSQYWFRGMAQENQGFIAQPWIDISVSLAPVGLDTVSVYGGVWNSIHTREAITPTGDETGLFETDWYVGTSIELPANFTLDVAFVSLHNPAGGDIFAEEIDVTVAYDDSELWGGDFALEPYVLVAFETAGGSDLGDDLGTYLEFGVAPGFSLVESEDYPIDLTIPMTVGFSLDNYYETTNTLGDEAFGFFDIGAEVSTPLSFMPSEYGSWSVYAGVHAIILGESTEDISQSPTATVTGAFDIIGSSSTEVYGVVGIGMEY